MKLKHCCQLAEIAAFRVPSTKSFSPSIRLKSGLSGLPTHTFTVSMFHAAPGWKCDNQNCFTSALLRRFISNKMFMKDHFAR